MNKLILDGVTLCKSCHYGFHKEYGFLTRQKINLRNICG